MCSLMDFIIICMQCVFWVFVLNVVMVVLWVALGGLNDEPEE